MEYLRLMGKLHAAGILFRNRLHAGQAKAAVLVFGGQIAACLHFYGPVKAVVHGDCQHLPEAGHVEADKTGLALHQKCGVKRVFQQVPDQDGQINILDGQIRRYCST